MQQARRLARAMLRGIEAASDLENREEMTEQIICRIREMAEARSQDARNSQQVDMTAQMDADLLFSIAEQLQAKAVR